MGRDDGRKERMMNNLSWFLYAVDVISATDVFFRGAAIISLFAIVPLIISGFAFRDFATYDKEKHDNLMSSSRKCFNWIPKLAVITVIFMLAATLTPSEKTMYMIAGSEFGEDMAQSETGRRVKDAINKKLDEYLSEEKK